MRDNISAKVWQLFKLFAPQCCKPAPTFLNSFAQKVIKRLIYKYNAPNWSVENQYANFTLSSVWKYAFL